MCWPSVRRLQGSCRGLVLRACSVFVVACESTESGPTAALAHISGCTIQREEIRGSRAISDPGPAASLGHPVLWVVKFTPRACRADLRDDRRAPCVVGPSRGRRMLYTSICSDRRAVRALNSSICAISDSVPYERCKLVSDVELFGMQLAFQVWVYFGCVGFFGPDHLVRSCRPVRRRLSTRRWK